MTHLWLKWYSTQGFPAYPTFPSRIRLNGLSRPIERVVDVASEGCFGGWAAGGLVSLVGSKLEYVISSSQGRVAGGGSLSNWRRVTASGAQEGCRRGAGQAWSVMSLYRKIPGSDSRKGTREPLLLFLIFLLSFLGAADGRWRGAMPAPAAAAGGGRVVDLKKRWQASRLRLESRMRPDGGGLQEKGTGWFSFCERRGL